MHRLLLPLWLGLWPALAATYDVGPAFVRTRLQDVPWRTLRPGDVVNVHCRPGGYHEKIQLSASGTADQPILVRGVPDPETGALPILDGRAAIEDPGTEWRRGAEVLSPFGLIVVSPRGTDYVYGETHVSFVTIESLDIRHVTYESGGSNTYTDHTGMVRSYAPFCAAIYVEWARDFTVRGCEISECGLGVFANSKNREAQGSARLLIEGNHFHDNSQARIPNPADPAGPPLSNGFGEHHIYTESAGCVIQFNRFGRLRPGARGTAIKDRSSGVVIRCNRFEADGPSNVFSLNDPQGGIGWLEAQADYRDAFVYGNVFVLADYPDSLSAFRWGAWNGAGTLPDGRNSYEALHRGTLHFYHNTVICRHRGTDLFMLPDATYTGGRPVRERVDCRNNVFHCEPAIQADAFQAMRFQAGGDARGGGQLELGVNWVSAGWRKDAPGHPWTGSLLGTSNLIEGGPDGSLGPRFVDAAAGDFHVLTGSRILNAAGPLASACLPAHEVLFEYLAEQRSRSRFVLDGAPDLGAFESTGLATSPPPGGAIVFAADTASVSEAAGEARVTLRRLGGSAGAASVTCSTTAGGSAREGADFGAVSVRVRWDDGDQTPKTVAVPLVNDSRIEGPVTVRLALSAPAPGTELGPLAESELTVTDDDCPPSVLMFGLADRNDVLFHFTSGPPVALLGFVRFSGLAPGDVLRALAVEPSTGRLFAFGSAGFLYRLNPFTGAATVVGSPGVELDGPDLDLAFERPTGRLHLFTAAGRHYRLDPADGRLLASEMPLALPTEAFPGLVRPQFAGADFAAREGRTRLLVLEAAHDLLATVAPGEAVPGTQTEGVLQPVGFLGLDFTAQGALHIPDGADYGWASLRSAGEPGSNLYLVNLTGGPAVPVGTLRTVEAVRDFAVASPWDAWTLARHGSRAGDESVSGDEADPDGNGRGNLIEFALGALPRGGGPTEPIAGHLREGSLELTFTRPAVPTGLIYVVQVSSDMNTWLDGSRYTPTGDQPETEFTTETVRQRAESLETITVRAREQVGGSQGLFLRLKISRP